MKIGIACSSGGHLDQIMEINELISNWPSFIYTDFTANSQSLRKDHNVHYTIFHKRTIFFHLYNLFKSFSVFIREKPDVIITTGAGIAIWLTLFAKITNKKIIFIETAARIKGPSLFGKIIYPIVNITIIQWKELKKYYKKSKFGGLIYNLSSESIKKDTKEQIFITVGTLSNSFHRLIYEIDKLKSKGKIKEQVIAQIGNSSYIPKFIKWTKFLNPSLMKRIMENSKIIIVHGGTGSIVKSIKLGKIPIVVPRKKEFSEIIDDHQCEICDAFSKLGMIIPIYNINELEYAINNHSNRSKSMLKNNRDNFKMKKILLKILQRIERGI